MKRVTPYMLRERVRRANLRAARVPEDPRAFLEERLDGEMVALRALLEAHYPREAASAPAWVPPATTTKEASG